MNEKYEAAKKRHWGAPTPPTIKHGPNTYAAKVYGCPCKVCLPSGRRKWMNREDGEPAALTHAQRQKRLRQSKKNTPVPPGTKHGIYTYRIYNCRCDICQAAQAAAHHQQINAWRENAHGRWTTVGENEMICWPPADAGPDWICPHPHHKEVA